MPVPRPDAGPPWRPTRRAAVLSACGVFLLRQVAAADAPGLLAFPGAGAVGLVPPDGYLPQTDPPGFFARDGSGVISVAEAELPRGNPSRAEVLAQFATISDRRLAAFGVRDVRRRTIRTDAIDGSLGVGTAGSGTESETVWSLYFIGAHAMGSLSWRVAGAMTPAIEAEMERVLRTVVTRAPAPLPERLAALPFAFDTALHDLTRVLAGAVILASRERDAQMLLALLAPDSDAADRTEAARRVMQHPLVLAMVRDPVWEAGREAPVPLAGLPGLVLRARVTQTPTARPMVAVLRVGFAEDGRRLVVLGCAPASGAAAVAAEERRFDRLAASVALR
ncbi:hypothetical protein ACE7GA_23485 [Roseomonas sp. CCTCC AB2023176]|uniref:hypothetical protein n=1 Tax=Roseomonas sp. CCTCC AB2023176 TaxID=3342640 RepID=UPI0035D812AF